MPDPLAVNPSTEVVRSGFLTKRGVVNKSWKSRFFTLTATGDLSYFEHVRTGDNLAHPLGYMRVTDALRIDLCSLHPAPAADVAWPRDSHPEACFWIHMSNRTYYLIAMDADDALQWVNALRRAAKIEQL